ncbi:small multi-drug export protein [Patescibacteria group bacterium]|nr:small multi-drug export protein [Patescibacteria group bacterium]MBU4338303.1 small multi-drug export protein [Patescibacteria group bacterium]MBU4580066.1 small multi-drug export protein [Patescibacteria group bacterium]
MSGELATFLTAMTPIGELRAAIPLALGVYKMSPLSAFFWSILGNISAAAIVLLLIKPVSDFLINRFSIFERFFNFLFARTRKKFSDTQIKWGSLALIIFVAIPLPVTGGWSGALAAYLFGIPFRRALFLISVGIIIAGLIVTGAILGVIKAFY